MKSNAWKARSFIEKKKRKKADFLDMIKTPRHRIAKNKFQLGNHLLRIETGRHTVPKTPEDLRLCHVCQTNEIENELYFLFSCTHYDNLRIKLFNELTEKYIFFKDLDSINLKILFLFNSIDPVICRSIAAYDCMNYRQELLFQKKLKSISYIYSFKLVIPCIYMEIPQF